MIKKVTFALLILLTAGFGIAHAAENTDETRLWKSAWLPKQNRFFPARPADPWDTHLMITMHAPRVQIGKLGTMVLVWNSVVNDTTSSHPDEVQFQIDLLIYNFMRKREQGGFSLDTTDTKFGFHFDFLKLPWKIRAGIKHISAHLADGILSQTAIDGNWHRRKRSYSREFLEVLFSYDIPGIRPYFGFHYIFPWHIRPARLEGKTIIALQAGGTVSYPISKKVSVFASADWQARSEFHFYINQGYIFGLELYGEQQEPFRFGIHLYKGLDPRGEFFWK